MKETSVSGDFVKRSRIKNKPNSSLMLCSLLKPSKSYTQYSCLSAYPENGIVALSFNLFVVLEKKSGRQLALCVFVPPVGAHEDSPQASQEAGQHLRCSHMDVRSISPFTLNEF